MNGRIGGRGHQTFAGGRAISFRSAAWPAALPASLLASILLGCTGAGTSEAIDEKGSDGTIVREVPQPKPDIPPAKKALPKEPLVTHADFPQGLVTAWWTTKDSVRLGDNVSVWRGARRIAVLEILRVDANLSVGRIVEDDPNERLRVGDAVRNEGRPGMPPPPTPAAPPSNAPPPTPAPEAPAP